MSNKPPIEVPQCAIRLNTDSQKLEFYAQDRWVEMATESSALSGGGVRAVIMSGYGPADTNTIDYFYIPTQGDAVDFGDDTISRRQAGGCSSRTRGINAAAINVIQFITMASTGDATDFGDLNTTEKVGSKGNSNSIRGIFSGGYDGGTFVNSISAINIATTGNAVDFGDISGTLRFASAVSDSHGGLE